MLNRGQLVNGIVLKSGHCFEERVLSVWGGEWHCFEERVLFWRAGIVLKSGYCFEGQVFLVWGGEWHCFEERMLFWRAGIVGLRWWMALFWRAGIVLKSGYCFEERVLFWIAGIVGLSHIRIIFNESDCTSNDKLTLNKLKFLIPSKICVWGIDKWRETDYITK